MIKNFVSVGARDRETSTNSDLVRSFAEQQAYRLFRKMEQASPKRCGGPRQAGADTEGCIFMGSSIIMGINQ